MRLAHVYSRACTGVNAPLIDVEVYLGGGLPRMNIVGLPETAVRESRDRVKAALANSGFEAPLGLATIALAPAELPKKGGGFDLPIALGILAASGQIKTDRLERFECLGELSLGGELRPVRGVLPAAINAAKAGRVLVVPHANAAEAELVRDGEVHTATSLLEITAWLNGQADLPRVAPRKDTGVPPTPDLADVIGQARPRRALEIAAAGQHHLLMMGPPGTGKSMLAARLRGILPAMSEEEALETAAIVSVSHESPDFNCWRARPFRAPHHTASAVALVGGGAPPRPGEISQAHNGVLFLDELPEFNRNVLEVLREPLETGRIHIARAVRSEEFPARFQLVAAMNPCPCGYHGDQQKHCICSGEQISRYGGKVSGPLLDRIDLFVEVNRPKKPILPGKGEPGEPSKEVRERVSIVRDVQTARQGTSNAVLDASDLKQYCRLDAADEVFFTGAVEKLHLSPRGCQRVLKVARTIADLDQSDHIKQTHLAEAISYRQPSQR